ncbi:hypothetical protein [Pseudarthrobacter sp. NPDC080039]|uniref:hypothetical protein n=1 Tax=unclassified Pseudarthrobacter TaxID=2647000 RepID=UPI00344BC83A
MIQAPLLAMTGDQSRWAQRAAQSIAGAAPHGVVDILTGQGHAVPDDILAPVIRAYFQ